MSRKTSLAGGATAFVVGALIVSGTGHTRAAVSDFQDLKTTATAGQWQSGLPTPPTSCGPTKDYWKIIYGTPGDDHFVNTSNKREIFMGMGGNDDFDGGQDGDCLVDGGGPGHSHFFCGSDRDILYGRGGDDYDDGGKNYSWSSQGFDSYTCKSGDNNWNSHSSVDNSSGGGG